MKRDPITEARAKLLADEISRQGLANVARKAGKPDRQILDMAAGRKSFGDRIAREIGEKIRPDLDRSWLIYPEVEYPPTLQESATILEINQNKPTRTYADDEIDLIRDFEKLSDAGKAHARVMIKSLVDLEAVQKASGKPTE